jgi:hypothetical protein
VRRALDRKAHVRGGGQIAKLFYKLSLPVSLQPKAPPILMRPAPLGGELTMKSVFLALVVATAASPALAADQIPAAFHGDWCSIAGKDDLYRRGRCPKGVHSIHITADSYSHEMGNCQVTGLLEARQAFLVDFDCRAKGSDSEIQPISMWMRLDTRDQLNMWIAGVTARESR